MKVIHVVPRIDDEASGPTYCVPRLSESLGRLGADVHLHVLAPAPAGTTDYRIHAHPGWRFPSRLGVAPAMRRALSREAGEASVIHNNGLWMLPNVYPAWAARGTSCRLVTSPHGTLTPWALRRSYWRKRLMWFLAQGRALRDSHCFHATAESEYHDIRAVGLRGPVAIIPIGIDLGPESTGVRAPGERRRLLFLGRLHPKKGIDNLLQAWQRIETQFPDWELRIVGKDEDNGYLAFLQELSRRLALRRVYFPGPAFGPDKTREFVEADLFVLPTHSENFGIAVSEALAHGLPAIVTKGAPWEGLETRDCGWWIEQGTDALTDCLTSAMALPQEQLRDRGRRGRLWMQQEFGWDTLGRMMFDTYRWLLGGGATPAWVRTD